MTPMIDIVFLLIIFFLVSSHLSRQENRHPVALSQASSGTRGDSNSPSLTITLDRDSQIHFAGTIISIDQLRPQLTQWLSQNKQSTRAPEAGVRLRIDRSIPYGSVEPILKGLAELSIANVAVIVNPRPGNANARAESIP